MNSEPIKRLTEKSGHRFKPSELPSPVPATASCYQNAPPRPKGSNPLAGPIIKQPGQASRPPQSPSAGTRPAWPGLRAPWTLATLWSLKAASGARRGPGYPWRAERVGSQAADPGRATYRPSLPVSSPSDGAMAVPSLGPREEDSAQHLALRGGTGPGRFVCIWDSQPLPCPKRGSALSPRLPLQRNFLASDGRCRR